jgi:hypothetical protein
MKYKYDDVEFTGSRSEIKEKIEKYLDGMDIWAKGEFDLGKERFCGYGNVSEIKRQMVKEVRVPYEFQGKLCTAKELRTRLNAMMLFDLVKELGSGKSKKLIIGGIMESLNEV